MPDFRRLTETMLASPQITPAEVSDARALGVKLIVNNRPDGESDDQPSGADIAAAAEAEGIAYIAIPVTAVGFSQPQVEAMREALAASEGPVLAYCRSGTRSTLLWSLAQASMGTDPGDIAQAAADAGYDVSPVRPAMDMLAARVGT
jgi:uncharacterized protein (TIGR01244 family)